MGTEAALMMAIAVVSLLLPMIVVKQLILRALRRKSGESAAGRTDEMGRLAIVGLASAAMVAVVLVLSPEIVAPHLTVALR